MKDTIVSKGPKVVIIDSPIPTPGPDDVVTKVVVSGSNPKDWYAKQYEHTISLLLEFLFRICLPV